jgi:nucleotide-binding universal stress UspA family protein
MAHQIRKILVAEDFSDSSRHALEHAEMIAAKFGAAIDLVHVVQDTSAVSSPAGLVVTPGLLGREEAMEVEARAQLENEADELRSRGLTVKPMVLTGDPLDCVIQAAKKGKADLLVVGTHGRTGIAHLLMGSVAESILRHAPCPVLCVRHPTFQHPGK